LRREEATVSYRDRINAVVQSLGAELGSPLSLAADGSLSLEFGGGRHCQLAVSDTEARVSRLTAWVVAADAAGHRWGLVLPDAELAPDNGAPHRHAALRALASM